jgi:adenosylmethionine-8-amino-7-oxononanoate aminotransferase
VEVQKIVKREKLLENVKKQGALLESLLKEKLLPMEIVGDVRGRGLFWGLELVRDKTTKTSFEPELGVAAKVAAKAMELGLAVLPTSGAGGEYAMDLIIVSPPYVVTEEEVRTIVGLLGEAVAAVAKELEV